MINQSFKNPVNFFKYSRCLHSLRRNPAIFYEVSNSGKYKPVIIYTIS